MSITVLCFPIPIGCAFMLFVIGYCINRNLLTIGSVTNCNTVVISLISILLVERLGLIDPITIYNYVFVDKEI